MDKNFTRRKFVSGSVTVGSILTAGCLNPLGGQGPQANHWAAGIVWSEISNEVHNERRFTSNYSTIFTGPAYTNDYLRINDGELHKLSTRENSVTAMYGDNIEYIVDLDAPSDMRKVVFEYTIPEDENIIGVIAGFAECLLYEGANEWVVRPLNVDISKDRFGQPEETLLVSVIPERGSKNPDWYIWGHNSSIRNKFRERAKNLNGDVDIEFISPEDEATFKPVDYNILKMETFDKNKSISRILYSSVDSYMTEQ